MNQTSDHNASLCHRHAAAPADSAASSACSWRRPAGKSLVVDVNLAGAEETVRLVEQAGGTGRVEPCDVTSVDAWQDLRERLQAEWPRLDLLVNNAGMYATGRFGQLNLGEADRVLRLNLLSVIYGCDTMIPWLAVSAAKTSASHIINVASIFAFYCPPEMAMYNLTKAGVVALSESLYGELKPRGVGVTVVCPGPMPTNFPTACLVRQPGAQTPHRADRPPIELAAGRRRRGGSPRHAARPALCRSWARASVGTGG